MHAKLYLFTETDGQRRVSVASSANLARKQAEVAWNDAFFNVGTAKLWEANVDYFEGLRHDRRTPFTERVETKYYLAWYFPQSQDSTAPDYYTGPERQRLHRAWSAPGADGVLLSDDQAIRVKDSRTVFRAYETQFDHMWDQSPDLTYDDVEDAEPVPLRLRAR